MTRAASGLEIGVFTFADVGTAPGSISAARRIPELLDEITLADEVGLDIFGLGEHHRKDFAAPAPPVILAAAAARTRRIRLTSAVTVLSTDDPVRVFEQFAVLDLVSSGRAEIMAGRGALLDSFRLFGHAVKDYSALFEEKLELLLALRSGKPVNWKGRFRPPLHNEIIYPRPVQDPLPVWLAVGGSQESIVRAGRLGLPMALALLGGRTSAFAPGIALYRKALAHYHHAPQPVALTVHGFVADDSRAAADIYYVGETQLFARVAAERGFGPFPRSHFDANIAPDGPHIVGNPEQVAEKIVAQHRLIGHERVLIQLAVGDIAHRDIMRAIELLGTKVVPLVRAELAVAPSLVAV